VATNLKNESRMRNLDVGAAKSSGDAHMVGPLSCVLITDTDAANLADVDFGRLIVSYDLEVTDTGGAGMAVGAVVYYDTVAGTLSDNAADKEYGVLFEAVGAGATSTVEVALFPGIEA
jgi:predicted RecA/RadA family phage recombinase